MISLLYTYGNIFIKSLKNKRPKPIGINVSRVAEVARRIAYQFVRRRLSP